MGTLADEKFSKLLQETIVQLQKRKSLHLATISDGAPACEDRLRVSSARGGRLSRCGKHEYFKPLHIYRIRRMDLKRRAPLHRISEEDTCPCMKLK